ncbi:MAG: hypothetical protein U0457_05895 [Candidatus Sericytochromatia bacterium]
MKLKKLFYYFLSLSLFLSNTAFSKEKKSDVIFETKDKKTINLYKNVEKIFSDVQKVRNLPVKRPVKIGIKTSKQVNDFLQSNLKKDYPEKMIKKDYLLLKKLGLIQDGTDIKKLLLGAYTQQIAGFYDEKTQSLYVVNNKKELGELETSIVISHELVHSLQDQYFHIKDIVKRYEDSDKVLAKTALIEGEATLASMQYIIENMGLKREFMPNLGNLMKANMSNNSKMTQGIPEFLMEQMMFPYIDGTAFCEYVYKEKGSNWNKFNEVYKNPPESTEQILHPEKYLAKEKPVKVRVNPYFLNDWHWELLDYDTVGEFFLRNWMLEYLDEKEVKKATEGWGGDRYAFFSKNNNENIFVYKSIWDSNRDAVEFFDGIKDTLKLRYENNLHIEKETKDTFFARSKEGYIYIKQKNKTVNFADGFNKKQIDKVFKYLNK